MKLGNPRSWTAQKIGVALVGLGALAGAITLLVVALTPESSATAKKNFCKSLDNLSSTVMNYQGLNPTTATNDQLDAAADDINDAWNDVVDNADDWANAYDNPLADAYDDLYYAIQDLPGDNTIAQDLEDLEPQLSAFPEAYHETFDGSGCSSV
jgi:hypothetical protein